MKSTYSIFRSTVAAATIVGIGMGSIALAMPALAADTTVTGFETGYSYHQGLANGDGAMLMANGDQTGATAVSPAAAPASSANGTAVSVAPPANPTVEVPAVAPAVNTAPAAATAQAAAPSFIASLTPAEWGAVALIALAVIIGIVMLLAEGEPRRTTVTTRSYQRYG